MGLAISFARKTAGNSATTVIVREINERAAPFRNPRNILMGKRITRSSKKGSNNTNNNSGKAPISLKISLKNLKKPSTLFLLHPYIKYILCSFPTQSLL